MPKEFEVINDSNEQGNKKGKEVDTELSLEDSQENVASIVQKDILKEEMEELPPIREGEIDIVSVFAFDSGEELEVKVYFRNGTDERVKIDKVPIVIINSNNEVLAYQEFDLNEMGEIPPKSARPWKLYFDKENVFDDKIAQKDWKIGFNVNFEVNRYVNIEYENLPKDISSYDRDVFEGFLSNLEKVKLGQFGVATFNLCLEKDGTIMITTIIRNGAPKTIKIDKIPVTIKAPTGETVISGVFDFENLRIRPFKAKICNLYFKTNMIPEQTLDLSECKVIYEA